MASSSGVSPSVVKKVKTEEEPDAPIDPNAIVKFEDEPVKEEVIKEEEVILKKEEVMVEEEEEPVKGAQILVKEGDVIFQFNIHLIRGRGAPQIWRRFQVPATYNFHQLHIAIQRAMGWKSVEYDYHLHAFYVVNPMTRERESIVTRDDLEWREDAKDEALTNIADYFKKKGQKGKYEYDFGISWMHEFVFEKSFKAGEDEKYPKCVEGAKACPPEDGVVHSDEEYDSDAFDPEQCFN